MYSASVDTEYSVYPSYNGIKSELYYRTFMVLFLKIFYVLFSVFYLILFPEFFGKRFLEFFAKKLGKFHRDYFANQYPDDSESMGSVRLTALTYVWSVRLTDKKSRRDISTYSHTRIRMWIPLYKKKTPAALPGFSQKVLLWNYGKNFCIIFSFFISVYSFIFSLVYSHDFNLNSYRLPVRDFNLNPPLAIAKGILLCHHQILNPAPLLLQ